MVTHRIKPMTIDGKKVYQIGIPIHYGYRGIQEDAGKTARSLPTRSPHVTDPNAHTPEFKGFLVKLEKVWYMATDPSRSKPSPDTPVRFPASTPRAITASPS